MPMSILSETARHFTRAAKTVKVYARATSGLVRTFSLIDAGIYNFLVMGMLTTVMPAMIMTTTAFFTGANIPLAYIIGGLGLIPFFIVVAMLVSSMPRSGGDYVFTSRILHPAIGFMSTTGSCTVYYCCWAAWNGWLLAENFSAFFAILGTSLGLPLLISWSSWAATTNGIIAISLFSFLFPALLLCFGMKFYANVQKILFAGLVVGSAVLLGSLVIGSQTGYINAFNSFMSPNLGPNAYASVIETAREAGYVYTPSFNWWHTVVFTGWAIGAHLVWAWFATPLAGEIKKAGSLWRVAASMLLPMVLAGAFMVAIITFFFQTLGLEFIGSISYLFLNGHEMAANLPFSPYYVFLPSLLFSGSVLLIGLMMFAYSCQLIYFNATNILNPVKYLFAQSFDSILPRSIAYVHPRYHTPLVAIAIMVIGSSVWMAVSWIWPETWTYVASVAAANLIQYMIILITGIAFPLLLKDVYEASPCSRYSIGGVPLISILGVLGFPAILFSFYTYMAVPELGAAVPASWATVGTVFIACFIVYWLSKWTRKKQGIDLELAFKEIPPE